MGKNNTIFCETKCLNKLSKALHNLWVSNTLTDVLLYVGCNSTFRCHKIIVLAFCPKYKNKILKTRLNEILEIKLPYSTDQGITQILSYMYTSEIHIHLFNFAEILISSYELDMDDLIKESESFIQKYIDERSSSDKCNVDDFSLIIRSFCVLKPICNKTIFKKLMSYVANNFDCLMSTEEFLDLDVCILKDFLSNYRICVNSEENLLDGILRWIRRDYGSRFFHEKDLLFRINFQFISPKNLRNFELSESIMNFPCIKKKILLSQK